MLNVCSWYFKYGSDAPRSDYMSKMTEHEAARKTMTLFYDGRVPDHADVVCTFCSYTRKYDDHYVIGHDGLSRNP